MCLLKWPGYVNLISMPTTTLPSTGHELADGDVVDIEFILGERQTPKISERYDHA